VVQWHSQGNTECEQWCSGTGRGTLNVSSGAVVVAGEH
jgi:hypothetical protein